MDTQTPEILSVSQRRSDVIESIHDGSFLADWVKSWIFLLTGIGPFMLWITDIYLFTAAEVKESRVRRR